jgi:hypothetical protein
MQTSSKIERQKFVTKYVDEEEEEEEEEALRRQLWRTSVTFFFSSPYADISPPFRVSEHPQHSSLRSRALQKPFSPERNRTAKVQLW